MSANSKQQTANSKQQTANSVYFAEKSAMYSCAQKNPSKKRLTDKIKLGAFYYMLKKSQKVI